MFLEVVGYAFPGSFEIDIDGRQVRHRFLNEQEQLALNIAVGGWTPENLAIWLDRQVHQMDIHHAELLRWLTDLILYLTSGKGSPRPVGWRVWCSGTVVLVKHGPRTTRRDAGCPGRLWRLIPSCRTSAELPRRFWSPAARPRRGALSADSIRREQVAAHLGDSGRDGQRHLHHEQRIDRLGEAASRFLSAGTGAYRDDEDQDDG